MPGRTFNSSESPYGFNGKRKDDNGEWGSATHYDYGFRIYNPAIAKFLSVDPLTGSYPWYTPYQFAGNTPIQAIDLDGLEEVHYIYKIFKDGATELIKISEEEIKVLAGYTPGTRNTRKPKFKINPYAHISIDLYIEGYSQVHQEDVFTYGGNLDTDKLERNLTEDEIISFLTSSAGEEQIDISKQQVFLSNVAIVASSLFGGGRRGIARQNQGKSSGVNLVLKYKKGWSQAQKDAAKAKVEALSKANTFVVKNPSRKPNTRGRFKEAGKEVLDSEDVDHIIDLQLNGADELFNMDALDNSVNRSLGSQIQQQIKNLPEGTKINKVIIQ